MILSQKRTNQLISIIFIVLTLQYTAFYYIDEGALPRVLMYVFYFSAILLPIILMQKVNIRWTHYRVFYIMVFFFVMISSIVLRQGDFGTVFANFVIYLSIFTAFLFTVKVDFLFRIFKILSIIGILGFIYAIAIGEIDIAVALKRGYTWTEIFFYSPLFWAVIPTVILAFLYEKNIILSLAYWLCAIVLNLLFLKRFIIVDSILLLGAILFINYHKEKKVLSAFKLIFIISILVGASLYFYSDTILGLLDATNERIVNSTDDVSSFDRFVETKSHFSSISTLEIILGSGFSGQHFGLGKEANALHVGWTNFLFKGGVLLVLVVLIPYFQIPKLLRQFRKLPVDVKFSVIFLLINIPRLMYINTHNLSPYMLLLFAALLKVMDFKTAQKTL